MSGFWDEADVISVYTRAQAIEDGVLVDVSKMAIEGGYRAPVALTRALWADVAENIPERYQGIQDWEGRLWYVLWMGRRAAASACGQPGARALYKLIMPVAGSRKRYYFVVAACDGGDDGTPHITLMQRGED